MQILKINPIDFDKNLPIPYYYQIVGVLRDCIEDSNFDDPDEMIILPSEPELSELFSVNRGTIRHALQVLQNEGFIRKEKGKGTFLRRRRLKMDLSRMQSTTEDIKRRGWTPKTILLGIKSVKPNKRVIDGLRLTMDDLVWEILRVHFANNEPISLQHAFIPKKIMPDLDTKRLEGSLYEIWKKDYQIRPFHGEQTIRTRLPHEDEIEVLKIDRDNPVFEITRISFDEHDTPIEFLKSIWRGDRYDFFVNLSGSSKTI